MNDEESRSSLVMIQRDQKTVTGKTAANCFIDSYEQVSNIMTLNNRKLQAHDEIKNHQADQDPPECMNCPFKKRSLKRPWKPWRISCLLVPTKLPMRCWNTLAPKQRPNSWESSTTGGRQGTFLRAGEKLICSHPHEGQGSSKHRQLSPYQPHQYCGQTHGKINQHSPGMAPGEKQHHHSRAGRLPAASFYWTPGELYCPEDWWWISG